MKKTDEQQHQLLNVKDVTALLKVSQRSVYRWKDAGKMPRPFKPGGKDLRWKPEVIQKWIEQGCPCCR